MNRFKYNRDHRFPFLVFFLTLRYVTLLRVISNIVFKKKNSKPFHLFLLIPVLIERHERETERGAENLINLNLKRIKLSLTVRYPRSNVEVNSDEVRITLEIFNCLIA